MDLSLNLRQIFPLTFSLLSANEGQSLVREFLADWGMEQLHFFPMMVKAKNCPRKIQEVADYEYLKYWLTLQEFEGFGGGRALTVNPSLQVFFIQESASFLKKNAGVYLLWKTQNLVQEKQATAFEAQILDRLQEEPLVLPAEFEGEDEIKAFSNLTKLGIIQEPNS